MIIAARKSRPMAGFTLIEILVALLILGIMSALGYETYRTARISAERTEEALQRSREIEFGVHLMVQDIAESVPRPVRDMLGDSRIASFFGSSGMGTLTPIPSVGTGASSGSGTSSGMSFASQSFNSGSGSGSGLGGLSSTTTSSLLEFTRAGWSNTAGQQRGTLQRVSYGLVDDVLKRSYQVNIDTVQGNKPVVQDLLTRVKAIQLRYLDSNQTWQSQWPLPSPVPTDGLANRPLAVELIIEFKDWGRIRRLIEVAG